MTHSKMTNEQLIDVMLNVVGGELMNEAVNRLRYYISGYESRGPLALRVTNEGEPELTIYGNRQAIDTVRALAMHNTGLMQELEALKRMQQMEMHEGKVKDEIDQPYPPTVSDN